MKSFKNCLNERLTDKTNFYVVKSWTLDNSIKLYNVILQKGPFTYEDALYEIDTRYNDYRGNDRQMWDDHRGFTVINHRNAGVVVENYFILSESEMNEFVWYSYDGRLKKITGWKKSS